MEALEITELKDSILLYLFDHFTGRISLPEIYYDLKPENISKEVFSSYMKDLVSDKLVVNLLTGSSDQYCITERGKRRLRVRGYIKQLSMN